MKIMSRLLPVMLAGFLLPVGSGRADKDVHAADAGNKRDRHAKGNKFVQGFAAMGGKARFSQRRKLGRRP